MLIGFTLISCLIARGRFQLVHLLILLCCKREAGASSFFPMSSEEIRKRAVQFPVGYQLGSTVAEVSRACIEEGDNDNKRES